MQKVKYADSDFILALVKPSDWLKERAEKILNENKGDIRTSLVSLIEIALVLEKFNLRVLEIFANLFDIIEIDESEQRIALTAASYIEENGLNVFDAFHAASCGNDTIISSDKVYDKIGLKRINLA